MRRVLILCGRGGDLPRQAAELAGFLQDSESLLTEDSAWEIWLLHDRSLPEGGADLLRGILGDFPVTGFPVEDCFHPEAVLDRLPRGGGEGRSGEGRSREAPQLYLWGSDPYLAGLSVRWAYRLGGGSCTGAVGAEGKGSALFVKKQVYSGYMTGRFRAVRMPFSLSPAGGFRREAVSEEAWDAAADDGGGAQQPEVRITRLSRGEGLEDAAAVVAGGRGAGSREGMAKLEELAGRLGGRLGAARPAVMSGWVSLDRLIGASGAVVSPRICLAVGVSGAPAFMAGIQGSRRILAVNRDPRAPLLAKADHGTAEPWQPLVEALLKRLEEI